MIWKTLKTTLVVFLFSLCAHAADSTQKEAFYLDTPPDTSGWGFNVGFGSQPYMEDVTRIGVVSNHWFEGLRGNHWRGQLDWRLSSLQAYSSYSISELMFSMGVDSKIYKDIVFTNVKLGVGMMTMNDYLYDGSIITFPITLGINIIYSNTVKSVSSIFIEQQFYMSNDYDIKKSLPSNASVGIDEDALFSGTLFMGVKSIF